MKPLLKESISFWQERAIYTDTNNNLALKLMNENLRTFSLNLKIVTLMKAQLKFLLYWLVTLPRVAKNTSSLDCRKYLILNPETESQSEFKCPEYLLSLSCRGFTLLAFDPTHSKIWKVCKPTHLP